MVRKRVPPPEATCCICLKRKKCTTERCGIEGRIKVYDNFLYSEEHKGWLCKPCGKKLEKGGLVGTSGQGDFFEK